MDHMYWLSSIECVLTAKYREKCQPYIAVANPDIVTVGGGSLLPMPGTLARWYVVRLYKLDAVAP